MNNNDCIHCGDDCGKHPIIWDGKKFCCNGCKTVFEIINENKLSSYYNFEEKPGIKIDSETKQSKFDYLDDEEIADKLFEFSEGQYRKVNLYIPVIHCSSCIWLLENLSKLNSAIINSKVNFIKKEVTITFDVENISLKNLVKLLVSLHYIPEITLDKIQQKKDNNSNKDLLYKIGIAGFCFGNIMLLSLPEYVPGNEYLEENFKNFFGIMNFFLAIPVFVYSGRDYLISAYKGLKHRFVNIDLPISIGMLALFIHSSIEIFFSTGSGYFDSLCGLIFFLLIGKWYQNRTYQALSFERDYRSYFPIAVSKLSDNKEQSTPIEKLKVGDKILIRNEELIPTDAIISEGKALIDYSFVTGESSPIEKKEGEQVFAGGKQLGSSIELIVEKQVVQSRLTQLWNQHEYENSSQLKSLIDKISKYFTLIVLAIGIASGLYWINVDPKKAIYALSSVLIVACPCALALATPFTYGNILRLLSKVGIYLKHAEVAEKLNSITSIVFDKTGTITQSNKVDVKFNGSELNTEERIAIKSLTRNSTHILSNTIYQHLIENQVSKVNNFEELAAQGISGTINSLEYKLGSAKFIGVENIDISNLSSRAYISISLKGKYKLHLISGDNDAEYKNLKNIFPESASICFEQSPHQKLEFIKNLQEQGETVLMIGDGLNDAGALKASDVGISIADNIYHFSPACDAILEADKFLFLENTLSIARKSFRLIQFSFGLSFIYNCVGLYFAIQGILSPIVAALLMPISSISVVGFVTLFSGIIAKPTKIKKVNTEKTKKHGSRAVQLN